jgi:nicotinamide-nucleotide amidase
MIGELIAVGDELTTGRVVNSTSAVAARELFLAGHEVTAMHTVGDAPALIGNVLRRAIRRAEFVIVTGGLGPTTDDLTNAAAAAALRRPTALHQDLLAKLRSQPWGGVCPQEDIERLAWLPAGAEILDAEARMAGHLLVHDTVPVFFLPGVPGQAVQLLIESVLPRLAAWPGSRPRPVQRRLYRTVGLSECEINRRLLALEQEGGLSIGYYPTEGEVHVSLTVTGSEAAARFAQAEQRLCAALGRHLYAADTESLAQTVGRLLHAQGLLLATAESCTGGLLSAKITAVPGSSAWFAGGVIAYSNRLKERLLTVDADLLRQCGAVSGPVAEAMATGLAQQTGADIAVAVTGLAGPDGGSVDQPVGTVFVGLWHQGAAVSTLHHFNGSRGEIQEMAAAAALDAVRRVLRQPPAALAPPFEPPQQGG